MTKLTDKTEAELAAMLRQYDWQIANLLAPIRAKIGKTKKESLKDSAKKKL